MAAAPPTGSWAGSGFPGAGSRWREHRWNFPWRCWALALSLGGLLVGWGDPSGLGWDLQERGRWTWEHGGCGCEAREPPGEVLDPGGRGSCSLGGAPANHSHLQEHGGWGAPGPAAVGLFAGSMMMAEHHRVLPESLNSLQPPTIEEETAPEWSESRSRSRKGVAGWGLELGPV